MSHFIRRSLPAAAGIAFAGWCTSGLAAEPSQPQGAADSVLEEVTVTARKRAENMQTTPVAVTAFTTASLARLGVENVADLGEHVANLSMISGQGGGTSQSQISIRGVGQSDFILTADQSVGLYVDGVYIPRSLGAALDLIDVQRIEVLRGPQGTLFGRNTTAGAVQIISAPPADHLAASVEATAGSFGRADFKGSVNVPLGSERLLSRFSVASLNQDGYGYRFAQHTDGADTEVQAARAQFRMIFTDATQADLVLDGSRKRGHAGLETLVSVDPTDPLLALYNGLLTSQGLAPVDARWITSDPNDSWASERNRDDNDIRGAALTLTHEAAGTTFRSITAYRQIRAASGYSFAPSPYPVAEQELNLRQHQWSQELQLGGSALDRRLDWITGLYYFREQAADDQVVPFFQPVVASGGTAVRVPGGFSFESFISQKTESAAAFGQGTYHLTDRLSTTFGARYTHEKKTLESALQGAFVRAPGTVDDSWSNVSPRLGLEYAFKDGLFGYGSISRGFRSGGFNGRNTTPDPPLAYDPEKITAYELGLKMQPPGGRWRLNTAAFYYDYSDFQGLTLTSFSGITVTVGNIADVKLWGAEFDLQARPHERLELSVSGGYTHQHIARVDPNARLTLRPDTRLVNAPEWTGSVAADWTAWSGAKWLLTLHGDYSFKSSVEFFLPNYPDEGQPGYGLTNARLILAPREKQWSLELFGENLTNREYRIFAENGTALGVAATSAVYGRPREWGLRARYDFE
ncbi:MAG TPA: TonB-dependent receptor [Steroidobacteraceae bacterium]|nr:TonB-dependent receptor [Steroidobacteraceae bacterium]